MKLTIIRVDMGQKYSSGSIWSITKPDGKTVQANGFTVDGTLTLRQIESDGRTRAWLETTDDVITTDETLPPVPETPFDPNQFGYEIGDKSVETSYQFPHHLLTYTVFSRLLADANLHIITPCRQLLEKNEPGCVDYSQQQVRVGSTITVEGHSVGRYVVPATIQPVTCWVETMGKVTVV